MLTLDFSEEFPRNPRFFRFVSMCVPYLTNRKIALDVADASVAPSTHHCLKTLSSRVFSLSAERKWFQRIHHDSQISRFATLVDIRLNQSSHFRFAIFGNRSKEFCGLERMVVQQLPLLLLQKCGNMNLSCRCDQIRETSSVAVGNART